MPYDFKTLRNMLRNTLENEDFPSSLNIIDELRKEIKEKRNKKIKKKIEEFRKSRDEKLKKKLEEYKKKYIKRLDLKEKKIADEVEQKYNEILDEIFSCEIAAKQNDPHKALECFKTAFPRLKVAIEDKEPKIEEKEEEKEEIVEATVEENYIDELARCLNLNRSDAETYAGMLQKESQKHGLKIDTNTAAYCYLETRNYNYKDWKEILKNKKRL